MDATGRSPGPEGATTAEEFVCRLAELRLWAGGPSLRRLRRLGGTVRTPDGAAVDALPPTTVSAILGGRRASKLPRWEFIDAFVRACMLAGGCDATEVDNTVQRWRRAWRALALTGPQQPVSPPRTPVPRQLPAAVAGFVGRASVLASLDDWAREIGPEPGVPRVMLVSGAGGVGKTTMTVHWAHRARDRFPDGQLYVKLNAFASVSPLSPVHALAQLLHALGTPVDRVPADLDEAAAMYRSLMADRKALVLLDDAASADQVRPLLPASEVCRVLVTSRNRLSGLVAREGASHLHLDVLPVPEADALVMNQLTGLVEVMPEQVAELVRLCGRLPLALRIAAANLVTRRGSGIEAYLERLRGAEGIAALAVPDDPTCSVAATFALSYAQLPEPASRLFRLLGAAPVADLTVEAAANLLECSGSAAVQALETLAAASLVAEREPGRYGCHDLLRRYAAEMSARDGDSGEHQQARERLYSYYLHVADRAAEVAYPQGLRLTRAEHQPPTVVPAFDDPLTALHWLDSECANLATIVRQAAEDGSPYWAWSIADSLRGYFWLRMHSAEWEVLAATALSAAQTAGNPRAEVAGHLGMLSACGRQGRFPEAVRFGARALELAEEVGWLEGQAAVLGNLGAVHATDGDLKGAVTHFERAVERCERAGWRRGAATALTNIGSTHIDMGQLPSALSYVRRALALSAELQLTNGQVVNLSNLGTIHFFTGDYRSAREDLERALHLSEAIGSGGGLCVSQRWLAAMDLVEGQPDVAARRAEAVIALAAERGYGQFEADARNVLAAAQRCAGDYQHARDSNLAALALADQCDRRFLHVAAQAWIGLGVTFRDTGEHEIARGYLTQAINAAQRAPFRLVEAEARTAAAELYLIVGDLSQAEQCGDRAYALHREQGHRLGEARTGLVLGRVCLARGDRQGAHCYWRHAQELFAQIGASETWHAEALLARLDSVA